MSGDHVDTPPVVAPWVRTLGYVLGILGAFGVAPIGLALDAPIVVAVGTALSGVGNALAFGYRPTR